MNMHLPQNLQTRYEIESLTLIPTQIISPKSSEPIIHIQQDSLTGALVFTLKDANVNEKDLMNIMMSNKEFDNVLPKPISDVNGVRKYSPSQTFSLILPDINTKIKPIIFDELSDNKNLVQIENGVMLHGILDKNSLGGKMNGLISIIYAQYGQETCKNFLDNTQSLITKWLAGYGFTIGCSDAIPKKDVVVRVKDIIVDKLTQSKTLIKQANMGLYKPNLSQKFINSSFEEDILNILNKTRDESQKIVKKSINSDNGFYCMINSGAKGNNDNLTHIMGLIGQQSIDGGRVPISFNNRTLPCFHRDDYGPESRGFIKNSIINGLEPHEFFFGSMAGRIGLIDTAIKSVTGDSKIFILENNQTKQVSIGEWIDKLLENNTNDIQLDDDRELLKLSNDTFIPTADLDGNVSWGKITAITRHNPSENLYEIITHGGRKVIVSDSHSLLVWNKSSNKFDRIEPTKVNVGDFVPVTAKLSEPPVINNSIDITQFLSKNEYIYGSDYIKAKNMLEIVMAGKNRAPAGWWNQHNGTSFTLPYSRVTLFLRSLWRNKVNAEEGCIYPYAAPKVESKILDKFELNYENGILLGLYIAEGNSDIPSGYVQITNCDNNILNFVKSWFDKYNIKNNINSKINHIGGNSTSVRGYSVLLARIFSKLVGHGARNKFIHEQCLNGNVEFIKGLLNGIFSGDGTITHNGIQIGLSSSQLITDINICLSRLGIFGKNTVTRMKENNIGTKNMADINMISIRGQWATMFKNQIKLIDNRKQEKLNNIKPSETHRNFTEQNDVVLDEIITINKLISKEHPNYSKLYDLTVPSTLNFGLANGLHVVDTAESGYIERRMVKAMEDLTVSYDGTVRTGLNSIVQFAYGDDSIDPIKLTKQNMIILDKNNEQLQKMYAFNELDMKTLETLTDKKVWDEISKMDKVQLDEDYEEIKKYRDIARTKFFFKNNNIMDTAIKIPVNFDNIVSTSIVKFNLQKYHKSDLSPIYIREQINNKLNEFKEFVNEDSLTIFEIMIKSFLSVKKCLLEYKLNKQVFDFIIETITNRFLSSFIQPGEAVGVLAAQSVGEPVSQLTLKSFHKAGLGVDTGAPRMKEVIEYSKKIKNPQLVIYLKDEYARNKDHAKYVMSQIEYTQLQDLVIKTEILYENEEQNMVLEEDQEFIKSYYKFAKLIGLDDCLTDDLSPWVLRVEFDKEALLNKNILINDIQELIMNNHNLESDVQCIFTDDNAKNLVLRIRVREEEGEDDLITFLQELEKTLMSITIKGIAGIENVNMQSNKKLKYNADGSHLQEEEWVLYTKGVNLIDTLSNEYIDPSRTISSDMTEIYETFGIEATRQFLINTFNDILAEFNLDPRHLGLLADVMTFRGQIMPIMRHGINRTPETGPLAKASFEMVTDVLYKAATYAEVDKMNGISGNIMMGQFIPAGTNAFDVLFDEVKYMKELEKVKDIYEAEMMENKMEEEDPISLIKKKVDSKMSQFKTTNINKEFDLKFDITAIPEFKI
jgi:DNA-directed RNA polymerase beta' subunit